MIQSIGRLIVCRQMIRRGGEITIGFRNRRCCGRALHDCVHPAVIQVRCGKREAVSDARPRPKA